MKKRPTILDIAAAAGVTDGTVSRALAGNPKVKESTRLRVQEAAARLGYRPHLSARALKQGSHGAVGIFCEGGAWMLYNDYYGQLLAGVARAAEKDGQRLVFYLPEIRPTDLNPANDEVRIRGLEGLSEGRVDGGIVVGGSAKDLPTLRQLRDAGLPLMLLSPDLDVAGFHHLGSGIQTRMALAANALLERGAKRLCLLGLFKGGAHNQQAFAAVRAAVASGKGKGVEAVLAELDHWDLCAPEHLLPQVKRLLAEACDAWIVSNPSQARVVLDLLQAEGLEAPRDLRLITFGPEPPSERARPIRLALVEADLQEEGERCYRMYQALKIGRDLTSDEIRWKLNLLPKNTLG